jgi:hypothetical protein
VVWYFKGQIDEDSFVHNPPGNADFRLLIRRRRAGWWIG